MGNASPSARRLSRASVAGTRGAASKGADVDERGFERLTMWGSNRIGAPGSPAGTDRPDPCDQDGLTALVGRAMQAGA